MAIRKDEDLLLSQWNPNQLGQYEGQWIAFRGQVIGNSESLYALAKDFLEEINEGNGPLFAYVSFKVRG